MKRFEEIIKIGEKAEVSGYAMEAVKANWRQICEWLGKGLSVDDVAVALQKRGINVSRRTIFNFLQRLGLSSVEIKHAYMEYEKAEKLTRLEKLAEKEKALKVVPSSEEELEQALPWLKDLKLEKDRKTITHYIRIWLDLCAKLNKHPDHITTEDLENYVKMKQMEWIEKKGVDFERRHVKANFSADIITPLRVFAQYQGLRITPKLKTSEYESPYRSVRLSVEARYHVLRLAKEMFPRDFAWIRASLLALYNLGFRAEELTNVSFEETEHYVIARSHGKRGLEYERVLSKEVYKYIKGYLPLTPTQLQSLRKKLVKIYQRLAKEGILKENDLTFKYACSHPLHVWRHTATNDLIDVTDYNLGVIAEQLGWKNPAMIYKVYGRMSRTKLAEALGLVPKKVEVKFEYVYNSWKEKAKKEGLL